MGEEVAAGYCAISAQGKYTKARSISLRGKLELIDAELVAIYEALKDLQKSRPIGKGDTYLCR
jgi:hypothetical protein